MILLQDCLYDDWLLEGWKLTAGVMQRSAHGIIQSSGVHPLTQQLPGDVPVVGARPHVPRWGHHVCLICLQPADMPTLGRTVQGGAPILVGPIRRVAHIQQEAD